VLSVQIRTMKTHRECCLYHKSKVTYQCAYALFYRLILFLSVVFLLDWDPKSLILSVKRDLQQRNLLHLFQQNPYRIHLLQLCHIDMLLHHQLKL
jgi:hypothetical protein